MATFRFYQDKEVTTWVRDYYNVEAETLEDAIKQIKEAKESLEDLEYDSDNVEFDYRDDSSMYDSLQEEWESLSIYSCDLEEKDQDGEILTL